MKNKLLFTCLFCALGIIIFFSCNQDQKQKPTTYNDDIVLAKSESCECELNWFPHSQTPAPAEGKGSPFDTTSTTNCIFHQWSWQKFLWLTSPQSSGNPLFLDKTELVTAHMVKVQPQLGLDLVLSSTAQAGGGGILKSNPNYNPDSKEAETVYYSIHVNDKMLTASKAYIIALNNGSLPASNSKTFPVGSFELKVSWVDTSSIRASELGSYYTTAAAVLQSDNTYKNTTVALLGMHVVGIVINHPEFIWATFEHNDMAPTYDWNSGTVSSNNNELIFATATTNTLAGIQLAPKTTHPVQADQAYTLFEFGIPRVAGNGFMTTSQQESANYNNIVSIDSCVAANLKDVFNNYYYKGSLWINTDGLSAQAQADTIKALGYGIAASKKGDITRGCVSNSNVTMETFEQTFSSNISGISVSNLANCFSCHTSVSHSSSSITSPLYISHVFDGALSLSKSKKIAEIDKLKLRQYLEVRGRASGK